MRRALLFSFILACKGGKEPAGDESPRTRAGSEPVMVTADPTRSGLRMELAPAGDAAAPRDELAPAAAAQPLSESATRALLARVGSLEVQEGDRQVFAKREDSLPPPLTGETVAVVFPPPADAAAPDVPSGPLQVLRRSPEGPVPLAPSLAITFDRPMVALSSQAVTAETVPVKLTPQPDGEWRWLGTRTLTFEPSVRFPMATTYTAEVASGTRSANGDTLDDAVRWTFTTPPLKLIGHAPGGDEVELSPVISLLFDQAVEPTALLDHVELTDGRTSYPIRLATAEDLHGKGPHPQPGSRTDAPTDRALRVVPEAPLPTAAGFSVRLKPGAPSAEGPERTPSEQGFSFRTYAPLAVTDTRCGHDKVCTPDHPWRIEFNNTLDPSSIDLATIRIEPPVTGMVAIPGGRYLTLQGEKAGSTTYTVTLPATVADRFGQTLGEPRSARFTVGKADPTFSMPVGLMQVLDPGTERPALTAYTRNQPHVQLEVYRVRPDQWDAYLAWRQGHARNTDKAAPPGERLADTTIPISGPVDARVETRIELAPYLNGAPGHLIVRVRAAKARNQYDRAEAVTWVQSTRLAVDAMIDASELVAFATDLADGSPASGAVVSIVPGKHTATTAATGLATLPLLENPPQDSGQILTATRGDDIAFLPASSWYWSRYPEWVLREPGSHLRWFTFDDRGLYKPGETVRVKGFIRRYTPGPRGDIGPPGLERPELTWTAWDARGNQIGSGVTRVTPAGGFDLSLDLPGTVNLGYARVDLQTRDLQGSTSHAFQIQEFRRPEFEVSAAFAPGPHLLGERATARVEASYYAGGGLPSAAVTWSAHATESRFVPPNHDDYAFGPFAPWWWSSRGHGPSVGADPWPSPTLAAVTDSTGAHEVELRFIELANPRPMAVDLTAVVQDVNRQAWTAQASALVHPASRYVGLNPTRSFVKQGQSLEVLAVVTDLEGVRRTGETIAMHLERRQWKYADGGWRDVADQQDDCEVRSAAEPVTCSFRPKEGGSYHLLATITDPEGRTNTTELRLWVAGGQAVPSRSVELEQVLLVPDRDDYAAGSTAEVFVVAPFAPAEGLVTWRREGLVHTERITLDSSTTTLRVPIEDAHVPNLNVHVELVGQTDRVDDAGKPTGLKRPAFASGSITLRVPPLKRTLSVEATPAARALAPGGSTSIRVGVKGADGKPVPNAEVVVAVVDEAVLALTSYQLADPLGVFYTSRSAGISDHRMRAWLKLEDPAQLVEQSEAPGSGLGMLGSSGAGRGGGGSADAEAMPMSRESANAAPPPPMAARAKSAPDANAQAPAIAVRTDFSALALFVPAALTDERGSVSVDLKLPDNLTRYRVMVVAVDGGNRFGKGESTITARHPVMVRPSPPRFLNFGDRFELSLVVQNQTDEKLDVELGVQATNAAFLTALDQPGDPYEVGQAIAGRAVSVPANDRVEVRIPAAADMAGTARFQAVVSARAGADAARFELPVWTPATSEAFATYGVLDQGAVKQPVSTPGDVWTQFGGLEITTSSTALQALTDAVLYLVGYPYDCSEQLASRVLAIAALRDVLSAFDAEGLPSAEAMEAAVTRDLDLLSRLQNRDGGFAFWRRGDPSWPYLSIHVAHALARAQEKGFEVPSGMRDRSLGYLKRIETHIPQTYSLEAKHTLIAYALYVREQLGDADPERAKRLFAAAGTKGLPLEALGWLLPTLHANGATSQVAEIRKHLANRVTETAGRAHFVTSFDDGARHVLLASNHRVDGVLLDALIRVDRENDLIPKLVAGLLAHRKRGAWGNTQENAFVLLALDRYFRTYEGQTPDFVARAWLGEDYVGEERFRGRETKRARIDVPMGMLTEKPSQDLVLQKDGKGRMYYRIGMRYAPRDLSLEPVDRGFTVTRRYAAIDDPSDVRQDADGTWRIRAGARVRVELSMVAVSRRVHVALVDPLPAGLEILNPSLAVSGPVPTDDSATSSPYWWWTRTWYEHENLRDERAEAFTTRLWEGVHRYSYVTRATTPGRFVAPPAKAEEMYAPETFGRSGTDLVVVE